MKEFVFVEFLFTEEEYDVQISKLTELGDDFIYIDNRYEFEAGSDFNIKQEYLKVSGKINSMTASLIKLQNPALAGKMRISYITDDIKNKYRR